MFQIIKKGRGEKVCESLNAIKCFSEDGNYEIIAMSFLTLNSLKFKPPHNISPTIRRNTRLECKLVTISYSAVSNH